MSRMKKRYFVWPYWLLMMVGPTKKIREWGCMMMVRRWLQRAGIECSTVKVVKE